MAAEHSGRFFHLNISWLMRKNAGGSGPRIDTSVLLKKRVFAERFKDRKRIAK